MENLTWAQRKTIIQTQFVSVLSKVISDGIFNVLKNKKHWQNKKNVKKRKKRALNKKRKKTFFYIYGMKSLSLAHGVMSSRLQSTLPFESA